MRLHLDCHRTCPYNNRTVRSINVFLIIILCFFFHSFSWQLIMSGFCRSAWRPNKHHGFFFVFLSGMWWRKRLPVFLPCDFKEEMRNLAEDLLPPEACPAISSSYRPFVTEGAPVQDQAQCVESGSWCLWFPGGCDECSLMMGWWNQLQRQSACLRWMHERVVLRASAMKSWKIEWLGTLNT